MKKCNLKPSGIPAVLTDIEQMAGYIFQCRELLSLALCHSSYAAEQNPAPEHNQRLEFLGDAVLQLILSERLFRNFPMPMRGNLRKDAPF